MTPTGQRRRSLSASRVLVTMLVVLGIIFGMYLYFSDGAGEKLKAKSPQTVASLPAVSQEVIPEVPAAPTFYDYEVKNGDWLSCLSLDRWQDIASDNTLVNPHLIYPGQKLKIRSDIVLQHEKICSSKKRAALVVSPKTVPVEGRTIGETLIPYCNIGADPVNPNRTVEPFEREVALSQDYFATMQTGSGKEVRCVLRQGEIVVADRQGRAAWIRACGNPILNNIFVADPISEIKSGPQEESPLNEERRAQFPPAHEVTKEVKKSGLIILKTFEGGRRYENASGGTLRDSSGNPVTDSSGNVVKTDR